MKLILSHPTGNSNVRAAVNGFAEANLLGEFDTTIANFQGSYLDKLSNLSFFSEIKRRTYHTSIEPFTRTSPFWEIGRLVSSKLGFNNLVSQENAFSIDSVYSNLDKGVSFKLKKLKKNGINSVYAYEDGALFSFREAKKIGIDCFYDLPIGYWRSAQKLLSNERERWPEWIDTLPGFKNSEEKLKRKDEELILADRIFVASSFTANTLKEFPGKLAPVEIIPYGFPPVFNDRKYTPIQGRPLKLLFVGGLSQRKGIADLFQAVENIGKHVELTVVGRKSNNNCKPLNEALTKHKWIPSLPHDQILMLMRKHDVLVFPSLFEGFGMVITEAMSQGTPVITTERTVGPDLINNFENGWLINAGSTESLQLMIENIIDNPGSIEKNGKAAMETARMRPWLIYGNELATAMLKFKQ
ncbi:glycosyltransferase family 4 protein [Mucilaginibacter sp.]